DITHGRPGPRVPCGCRDLSGRPPLDRHVYNPIFVFNYFVRGWGHQFIYDPITLERLLIETGFMDVKQRSIQESEHPELRGLENESRMSKGFLNMESMIM